MVTLGNSANNYTGATTIFNGATLRASGNGALSAGSDFTVNSGGTLDLHGWLGTVKSLSGAGIVDNTDAIFLARLTVLAGIFSGVIRDTGADLGLTKNGADSLFLIGDGNSYTGTTIINGGFLALGIGGATGSIGTGAVTVNAGAPVSPSTKPETSPSATASPAPALLTNI